MGCRLTDFDVGEWRTISIGFHKVDYALATTKPIKGLGLKFRLATLSGHVYKVDGRFKGFMLTEDKDALVRNVTRELFDSKGELK